MMNFSPLANLQQSCSVNKSLNRSLGKIIEINLEKIRVCIHQLF